MARCLNVDDAFAAGWADGAGDEPLSDWEISQMVALHAPHLRMSNVEGQAA